MDILLREEFGAGNETRTRDPDLGKVVLYQLSYSRLGGLCLTALSNFGAGNETRTRDPRPWQGRALPTELFRLIFVFRTATALAAFTHLSHILFVSSQGFVQLPPCRNSKYCDWVVCALQHFSNFWSGKRDSNSRPPDLGKVVLYQLSYSRVLLNFCFS